MPWAVLGRTYVSISSRVPTRLIVLLGYGITMVSALILVWRKTLPRWKNQSDDILLGIEIRIQLLKFQQWVKGGPNQDAKKIQLKDDK